MGISRETLKQIGHVFRPLATKIANMVARSVVQLVDDKKKLQLVQIGVLAGETIEGSGGGAEHFQPYGFTSVPLVGAEGVAVFPSGDRSHPLLIAVSDRRHRPTGGEAGQVTMYHHGGAKITMLASGDIKVQPGPGGKLLVDDGAGATALPTMADFNGIISIMNSAGVGAGTALPAAVSTYQGAHPLWPAGTGVLKAK